MTAERIATGSFCGCIARLTVTVSAMSRCDGRTRISSSWSHSNDGRSSLRRTSMVSESFCSCVDRSSERKPDVHATLPGSTNPSISSERKLVLWHSVGTTCAPAEKSLARTGHTIQGALCLYSDLTDAKGGQGERMPSARVNSMARNRGLRGIIRGWWTEAHAMAGHATRLA